MLKKFMTLLYNSTPLNTLESRNLDIVKDNQGVTSNLSFTPPVQDTVIDPRLLKELKSFNRASLKKGTILYHGSRENSPATDAKGKKLRGSRKWVSQDIITGTEYAYHDSYAQLGKFLLWKLELTEDLECLQGSQFSLRNSTPWGSEFPSKFPNNFSLYAKALIGEQQSYVLLDHIRNGIAEEILITDPVNVIQVLKVYELPEVKEQAILLAKAENLKEYD